jgi:hypothetical protein
MRPIASGNPGLAFSGDAVKTFRARFCVSEMGLQSGVRFGDGDAILGRRRASLVEPRRELRR